MTRDTFDFDSLAEFLAEAEQPPRDATLSNSSQDETRPDFHGSTSYAHALTMARYGWPEGLARMEQGRAAVQVPETMESPTPLPVISEDGDEILVDRYLDGESDHFLAFPQALTPRRGRIACVVVNVGGSRKINPDTYFRRGAAALAVVDALERAGIRCEVRICQTARTRKRPSRTYTFRATLKRPEDPLELDRMAFFLASQSVQRRFLFRLRERTANPSAWTNNGYGESLNFTAADLPEGAIYFPAPDENITEAQAVRMAQDKLSAWTAEQ
jgi:hypothetical protein